MKQAQGLVSVVSVCSKIILSDPVSLTLMKLTGGKQIDIGPFVHMITLQIYQSNSIA